MKAAVKQQSGSSLDSWKSCAAAERSFSEQERLLLRGTFRS